MIHRIKNRLRRLSAWLRGKSGLGVPTEWKRSYAQCGEDLIVGHLLKNVFGISKPTYLDIGTNHPVLLSNTYLFYEAGCSGVCVEPDAALYEVIRQRRPRDVCLNVGVGKEARQTVDFFVFDNDVLSTFSTSVKDALVQGGTEKVNVVRKVDLVTMESLFRGYFKPWPNFVSIDTEGGELEILQSIDFTQYRPEVLCVETSCSASWTKIPAVTEYMQRMHYVVYADTNINTVYVEEGIWLGRLEQRRREMEGHKDVLLEQAGKRTELSSK